MPTMLSALGLNMVNLPSRFATTTPSLMLLKMVSMSWVWLSRRSTRCSSSRRCKALPCVPGEGGADRQIQLQGGERAQQHPGRSARRAADQQLAAGFVRRVGDHHDRNVAPAANPLGRRFVEPAIEHSEFGAAALGLGEGLPGAPDRAADRVPQAAHGRSQFRPDALIAGDNQCPYSSHWCSAAVARGTVPNDTSIQNHAEIGKPNKVLTRKLLANGKIFPELRHRACAAGFAFPDTHGHPSVLPTEIPEIACRVHYRAPRSAAPR